MCAGSPKYRRWSERFTKSGPQALHCHNILPGPLGFMQTAQPILKALPRVSDIKCTKSP